MMRSVIAVAALVACSGAWAEQLNTTCSFETLIVYRMPIDEAGIWDDKLWETGIDRVMVIADSKTSEETLNADGQTRATNSSTWTRVGENSWSTWAGDFGDLLTIHSLNEPMGTWSATLQYSNNAFANTYVGTCIGKF